ncbi:hypothetical protein FQZ97_791820 [compost metagenome]
MKAAYAVDAAEHRVVWPPAVPEEFDHGDDHRQADAGDRAEHGNADEAGDGEPELPALDAVDTRQVLELEEADGGGDHHGGQGAVGQVLQQVGGQEQQQRHPDGAEHAGQLRLGTGRFRHRRTRRTAADGEALEKTRRQVGHAQADHFLVGVHRGADPRRIGA